LKKVADILSRAIIRRKDGPASWGSVYRVFVSIDLVAVFDSP
jgi:hypothetical protein